ncbi:hypothetical protein V6C27_11035 [Peptococcaceae bacterium 1198_IL3148]
MAAVGVILLDNLTVTAMTGLMLETELQRTGLAGNRRLRLTVSPFSHPLKDF